MTERCHDCWNLDSPDTCTCHRPSPVSDALLARRYLDALRTGIAHPTWSEWPRRAGLRLHHDPSHYARDLLHDDVVAEAVRAIKEAERG